MTHRARRAVLVVTTLLALVPGLARAESHELPAAPGDDESLYRCKSRTAEVAIHFKPDIELEELITWVVGFTCKNFIIDPRVVALAKKVTIVAPAKMTAREAYRLFLVALSTMQLTVVPKGNVMRIVDAGAARGDTVPIFDHGRPDTGDQVVRYVLRPKHAAADVLAQALGTLKSSTGDVQQVGTMLMITDYATNLRDMLSLVKLVDVPAGSEAIYTIAIEHANAKVVAENVGGILGVETAAPAGKPGAPAPVASTLAPSKVLVDERTNTIILAASEVAYERFHALAKRIDIPLEIEGGASIHVYRLKNAIAEQLAKTLNETVGNQPAASATPATPARPAADAIGTAIDGKVRVIADNPTNALIVLASGRDFLALKEVIASLDLPRPQVYIETMIVEVGLDDGLTTEGSLHGATALDKAWLLGGVHTGTVNSTDPKSSLAVSGIVAGLLGPSVNVLGLSIPSYGALFNALADKSRANILSTPSMMALDNETAKFKVGKNIPYIGRTIETPLSGTSSQSIERENLNLELEIKPHISADNSVLLEVKLDSKEEGGEGKLGPTWNNRNVATSVLVRDQQTIVIGGLMQEKTIYAQRQVPLLGDIPLLGHFFKSTDKRKRKANMLILLTPYIVRNQLELELIKQRKLREHEEFVGSLRAFEAFQYQPRIDYARKRGLVEDINRAVEGVEQDTRVLESVRRPAAVPTGPIEIPRE